MELADRLELHELPGRYGDAIDDRDWEALAGIFTDDAVFDLTDLGVPLLNGLADIKRFMRDDANHPRMHLMTNIYADDSPTGARLHFRILTRYAEGPMVTASYHDDVVRTDAGWRVRRRVVTRRRTRVTSAPDGIGT